jgi:plastocyanin
MVKHASVLAALIVAALLVGACGEDDDGGSGSGSGDSVELVAQDFSFDPTTLDLPAGEEVTVTLTNEGEAEHSFTVEDLDVETEAEGGESAEVSFTAPDEGAVEFHCKYHPDQMTGEISVDGSAAGGSGSDQKEDDSGGGDDSTTKSDY